MSDDRWSGPSFQGWEDGLLAGLYRRGPKTLMWGAFSSVVFTFALVGLLVYTAVDQVQFAHHNHPERGVVRQVVPAGRGQAAYVEVLLPDGTITHTWGVPDPPPEPGERVELRVSDRNPKESEFADREPDDSGGAVILIPIVYIAGVVLWTWRLLKARKRVRAVRPQSPG